MASGEHFENISPAGISQVIWPTPPKQGRKRKAKQLVKILSGFDQTKCSSLQVIMPCLMLFDAKLRRLTLREPVGGR